MSQTASTQQKKNKRDTLAQGEERLAYGLLAPTLIILFAIALFPLISVFYYSLTNRVFASAQATDFVGLDNYRNLLSITVKKTPPSN
jgi:trehalose/maltose transport system permease protein